MRGLVRSTVVVTLLCPTVLQGQYFGQNRVTYRDFEFSIIETAHFDVYYYPEVREAALDAARLAERAYARLSRLLSHQYRERQPIILFASHSEFQQNNLVDIGEGVEGVTDPFRHRVMLPFTGSLEDFDHVLQHELVHQFQFDIFARGRVGAGLQRLIAIDPPLWLMEGMAEYLSLGPIHPLTAMWLRDAALEGKLPTIEQLTTDPRIFPYRYGHALLSYIGERWGVEVIADLLHSVATSGLEGGFQRALRTSMDVLTEDWHDAIQREYLPQIADRDQPRKFAEPLLTRERSKGRLHVAPMLSPDGSEIAYFSEGGSYSIDIYLADVGTGRVKRRIVKGAFSANFESLRFINSAGAWSRDGRFFAFPAKRGGRDDLVIFDMVRRRIHRRIDVPLAGIANPTWAPEGDRLAFTGLSGGYSDLFVINANGTHLTQLTNDRHAALHPTWSPDGRAIAFVTDRGGSSDLADLRSGKLAVALYHLDTESIELIGGMEGTNINPQWSPDGGSIAFVSDRTGVANVFLYEVAEQTTYQLTDVFTGISGITEKSPAISWAATNDKLALTYYEDGEYNVYAVDNPRSLKRDPYPSPQIASDSTTSGGVASDGDGNVEVAGATGADGGIDDLLSRLGERSASFYRTGRIFRFSSESPSPADRPAERQPTSVRALLDSATLALPDTGGFGFRRYSPTLRVDYVVQPTIGYQRDNFGQGIFGGTSVSLSDLLGNRRVLLGGQVNGRIEEAELLAVYANMASRINWAVGYQQAPTFFYESADITADAGSEYLLLNQRIRRFVVHSAFVEAYRPFSRFERLEARLSAANVSSAELNFQTVYDPLTGFGVRQNLQKTGAGSVNYLQPSAALVFDNAVSRRVGPVAGRRSRFEYALAFGEWDFHQALADYRRYDRLVGSFTLATRGVFFGRFGRDSNQFPMFLGTTELIRGYTSGSYRRRECAADNAAGFDESCAALNQLVGSRLAVLNAEVRFPLIDELLLGMLPHWFPPMEGAVFFDGGMAWQQGSSLKLNRSRQDDLARVRAPLASWGLSIRGNFLGFLILRGDYAKPLSRASNRAYWTISLGPTF